MQQTNLLIVAFQMQFKTTVCIWPIDRVRVKLYVRVCVRVDVCVACWGWGGGGGGEVGWGRGRKVYGRRQKKTGISKMSGIGRNWKRSEMDTLHLSPKFMKVFCACRS